MPPSHPPFVRAAAWRRYHQTPPDIHDNNISTTTNPIFDPAGLQPPAPASNHTYDEIGRSAVVHNPTYAGSAGVGVGEQQYARVAGGYIEPVSLLTPDSGSRASLGAQATEYADANANVPERAAPTQRRTTTPSSDLGSSGGSSTANERGRECTYSERLPFINSHRLNQGAERQAPLHDTYGYVLDAELTAGADAHGAPAAMAQPRYDEVADPSQQRFSPAPWFHGNIDRRVAEVRLRSVGVWSRGYPLGRAMDRHLRYCGGHRTIVLPR